MHRAVPVLALALLGTGCMDVTSPPEGERLVPDPSFAPAAAANRSRPMRVPVFGALNVDCGGATDLTTERGFLHVRVVRGGLRFTMVLKGAEPDFTYAIGAHTGSDCSNLIGFAAAIVTDADGNGSFSGLYPLAPGSYSVLITASTSFAVSNPANRDIGNALIDVVIPSGRRP